MTALPLAVPGAALGLFLTRNTFGFTASLASLAGRTGRQKRDYPRRLHSPAHEDESSGSSRTRGRRTPIAPDLSYSMAAAVGVVPMIISGSSMWSPMASVIAFGLVGLWFTLVAIPVFCRHAKQAYSKRDNHHAAPSSFLVRCIMQAHPGSSRSTRRFSLPASRTRW